MTDTEGMLMTLYVLHALQKAGCIEQKLDPKEGIVKWVYKKGGQAKLRAFLEGMKRSPKPTKKTKKTKRVSGK